MMERPEPRHNPMIGRSSGFSLVELMIAVVLGALITLALLSVFLNVSRTNNEMAKTNFQVESGRFAIQILEQDIQHAGFWGGYVPQFDNLMTTDVPADVPTAVPDPCLAYASWTDEYRANLIGIPVSIHSAAPGTCATAGVVTNVQANTDILVVRHADTCAPGEANCEADTAGPAYFQPSFCAETAQAGTANSITLAPHSSSNPADYEGSFVRIIGGTGAGQSRLITDYDEDTKVATVDPVTPWDDTPDNSSIYTIGTTDYELVNAGFGLRGRTCDAFSPKRKFVSHIYFVRTYSTSPGDGIPTLVRARLHHTGGTPAYMIEPLIEGIEGLRFEIGTDELSETGAAVDFDEAVNWSDPDTRTTATNRGDGIPDNQCTTATGCTLDNLVNAVLAKVYVLARTVEQTRGPIDQKTYCLATRDAGGDCPAGYVYTPSAGNAQRYSRHVFSTTVRLHNIAARRDTP